MDQPWYLIDPAFYPQPTGTLGVLEMGSGLPFVVRRVYWIFGVPDAPEVKRGNHAHRELKQVLICTRGSAIIDLEALDGRTEQVKLHEGGPAVFLDGPTWRTLHSFSPDASIVLLCDRIYAEDQVIYDRSELADLR